MTGGVEQRVRRRPGRVVLVLLGALILVVIAGLGGLLAPTLFYGLGGGLVASLLIVTRDLVQGHAPRANLDQMPDPGSVERADRRE